MNLRAVCLLCSLLPLAGAALVGQEAAPASGLAPALAGHGEEDAFLLYVNEEPLVQIGYRLEESGAFHGTTRIALAGQEIEIGVDLAVDDAGRLRGYRYRAPQGEFVGTLDGSAVELKGPGLKEAVEFTLAEGTVVYDDYQPALLRFVLEAYDREAGGSQEVPLFVLPGNTLNGALELLGEETRPVAGQDLRLSRWKLTIASVELFPWADQDGRILRVEVPSQHAIYVRDGFEALASAATPADPLLSRPEHDWLLRDEVMVPMRDGVHLATDIYLPDGKGPWPAILVRTPYKKEMSELQAKYYARRGYVFAIQDCRGRFASEGEWTPFFHEPEDGYDTIEWLAAQGFCNGRVGMIGASYLGWVQWWAARERPPHLVTIVPNVAPPDPWYNIPYEYGCFFLTGAIWWANVLDQEATADLSGQAMRRVMEEDYEEKLRRLPVIDLDEIVLGHRSPYWRSWIAHPDNDAWWDRASFLEHLAELDIPVFHQSGWFDGDGIGSKLNYQALAPYGRALQKLVIGPWGHTDTATRRTAGTDYGPEAVVDLQQEYLRWFDRWLKGVDNGIDKEPLVRLFVTGSNHWLAGDRYPLEATRFQKWYLRSGGVLSPRPPDGAEEPDRYSYDPGEPTPSPLMDEEVRETLQERQDLLIYRSPPLEKPLTIAGPLTAVLHAATDARDTDWFLRFAVEDAEGEIRYLAEGRIRARYRKSHARPELLEPGEVFAYTIDCWQTGVTVVTGERLRVEVASAAFPLFSRNLNTGGHNETETEYVVAHQVIYHDALRPSHLLLPVIPEPHWVAWGEE